MMQLNQLPFLIFCTICSGHVSSQDCDPSYIPTAIDAPLISARLVPGASVFSYRKEPVTGNYLGGLLSKNADGSVGPSLVYASSLWLGALDPVGNLKVAADYYPTFRTDFAPGPIRFSTGVPTDSICWHWDQIWKVKNEQVLSHLADLADNGKVDVPIPAIYGWPARGNIHFADYNWWFSIAFAQDLAPFHDADGNNLYDPDKGDYPIVRLPSGTEMVPSEFTWQVYNDIGNIHENTHGAPLKVEVQEMSFSFNCPEMPQVLNRTLFIQQKIINRGFERLDSMQMGLFVDFDLGCYSDDYMGSSPAQHTIFAYNRAAIDGEPGPLSCPVTQSFGANPPVASLSFLNRTMDHAMYFYKSGLADLQLELYSPTDAPGYFNILNGHWSNGEPLVFGNTGYPNDPSSPPTNYAYPDSPLNPNGWSMYALDAFHYIERNWVVSHNVGTLDPGGATELVTAWSMHRETGNDHLSSVSLMYDEVDDLQAIYNCNFACVCAGLLDAPEYLADNVHLFPNPTSSDVSLRYGNIKVQELRVFDATGKLVQSLTNLEKTETLLHLGSFPTGIYTLRLTTEQGAVTKRLVVAR